MTFLTIYQQPVLSTFKTRFISWATLYQVAAFIITLGVPIVLVAVDSDSWPMHTTFYEQPKIRYQQMMMLDLILDDGSSITWSTIPAYNQLHETSFRPSFIKFKEIDENGDSVPERINFSVDVPLRSSERAIGVDLILFMELTLQERTSFEMGTLAHFQHGSSLPGSGVSFEAMLRFVQGVPLKQGTVYSYAKNALWNSSEYGIGDNFSPRSVLSAYSQRNVSTSLDITSSFWPTTISASNSFHMDIILRIPVSSIWLETTILHRLSTAGALFIFWLIIFWTAMYLITTLVFSQGIIPVIRNPEKYSVKSYLAKKTD